MGNVMRPAAVLGCLSLAVAAVGCSPGTSAAGKRNVFTVASGFSQGGPGVTTEILDIGLPALINTTASPVRLTGISLAATSNGVRIRNVTAFRYGGDGGLGLAIGDEHKCPGAHPVTAVTTPPHAHSAWYVVIAVTFAKRGRYHIGRARIDYTTDGHPGWQYQNLYTTMLIKNTLPGMKRRSDGCP